MKRTVLCELVNIEYPIIQAPMTWITCAEMVAAVSEAGGLGTLAANAGASTVTTRVSETGERLRQQIIRVKCLTKKPFAVNLVLVSPTGRGKDFSDECLKVVLEEKVPVVITIGSDPEEYTGILHKAGIKVLHRAMPINVKVARQVEKSGVDALIAVGFDGGGHSGIDAIPTFSLLPQIVSAVNMPVIAGGGVADGRGLVAALALGAVGVYMGTSFIAAKECPAHPKAKQALIEAADNCTVTLTGAIGMIRAQHNPLMDRCQQMVAKGVPAIEVFRSEFRAYKTGLLDGDLDNGNLGWGAAAGLVREIRSARAIIEDVMREADEVLARLRNQ